jgi:hypothetical protein
MDGRLRVAPEPAVARRVRRRRGRGCSPWRRRWRNARRRKVRWRRRLTRRRSWRCVRWRDRRRASRLSRRSCGRRRRRCRRRRRSGLSSSHVRRNRCQQHATWNEKRPQATSKHDQAPPAHDRDPARASACDAWTRVEHTALIVAMHSPTAAGRYERGKKPQCAQFGQPHSGLTTAADGCRSIPRAGCS